jgi:hypothetical protein
MAILRTEVDGVPTLIAPTAGQMHAGLVFRVGRADETLARSGLTHLLEHLVLFPLGLTDYHYNGSTGAVTTSFHTAGSNEDVATFLTNVCNSLAALPLHRLEIEKSIVRTEWSSRTSSISEPLALWRYGARSYGLLGYPEPGIHALTADDVLRWCATWFTRENAVLWIAGDAVPAGLRLNLPSGQRYRVPAPTSALPVRPAFFREGHKAVAFETVVRRTPAVPIYAEVLERTLFRDLRQEAGVSYSANAISDPRGDGSSTMIAVVDALPDKLGAAVGGFVDSLAKLTVGRIERADIASYLAKAQDAVRHPDAEAGTLSSAAFELLTGQPVRGLEERMAEIAAVTVEDVHAVAVEAMRDALFLVPEGHSADWAGFTAAPTHSASAVSGIPFPRLGSGSGPAPDGVGLTLLVGAEGVTTMRGTAPATVRFDEVAAMLAWPDGGRQLIGYDGLAVPVEPTLNGVDPGTVARIDAAVTSGRTIWMPARDPGTLPRPAATPSPPSQHSAAPRSGKFSRWEIAGILLSAIPAMLIACLAGLLSLGATGDNGSPNDIGWATPIATWICMLVIALPAIVIVIRGRRRRRHT